MRFSHFLCFAVAVNLAAEVCPVTKPPNPAFVPPAPYQVNPGLRAFWFGDKDLWTLLPATGIWKRLPHGDDGYSNKLFLWQEGYDVRKDPQPEITVVVRRLDANAPIVTSRYGTNAFFDHTWAMLTGVTFPAEGCWEVASSHAGHSLTFVLSIQP
jgi:hypothetical protein